MKKNRKLTVAPDDVDLFRAAVSGVTPLSPPPKVVHPPRLPRPLPAHRGRDTREALNDDLSDHVPWHTGSEAGEELLFARNGISGQTLRKLRRGHWPVQAQLDLHGLTVDQARGRMAIFLRECENRNWRCVRVIHGKGLGSRDGEPVLKRRVAGWLMQHDGVLAFCQARRADGGSGAVMVLLKNRG